MPTYHHSIEIKAPLDVTWSVLSQVAEWPQWLPTVSKVEPLDGSDLAIGHRFVLHQPKIQPTTWTVSEIESQHRFTWRAKSLGVRLVADHILQKTSSGSIELTLEFSFRGLMGWWVGPKYRPITMILLAKEAKSLKRRAETLASQ
ncbi:MAG: SRPBCC family protein [Pirellulales bacterium]